MMQPEGFANPKGANKMCKLQRSINGLVQASRSWNIRFDELIKAYGFIQTFGIWTAPPSSVQFITSPDVFGFQSQDNITIK